MWTAVAQTSFCLEANSLSVLKEGADLSVLSLPPPVCTCIWINVFVNVLGKCQICKDKNQVLLLLLWSSSLYNGEWQAACTSKQSGRKYLRSLHQPLQQIKLATKGLENNLWALGCKVWLGIGVCIQFVAIGRKRIIIVQSTDQIHALKANTEKLLA